MSNRQLEQRNWKLECSIADAGRNCNTTTSNAEDTSKIQKLNFGPDGTPQLSFITPVLVMHKGVDELKL